MRPVPSPFGWNTSLALVPSQVILSTDEMGRIAPPIFESVGRDGANKPGDVFVIQSLLNDRLPQPHSPVPVTGEADIGTVLAIEAYQAVVLHMLPPTGKVDPGSQTYYALAARPLLEPPKPGAVGRFGKVPPDVVDAAVASRLKWSVPASITMAQWAVESAWGASMPPGSNNPFGIKARPGEPAVDSMTREFEEGQMVTKPQPFRKFEFADRRVRRARPVARDRQPVQEGDGRQGRSGRVRGRADRRLCDRPELRHNPEIRDPHLRLHHQRQVAAEARAIHACQAGLFRLAYHFDVNSPTPPGPKPRHPLNRGRHDERLPDPRTSRACGAHRARPRRPCG